MRAGAKVDGRTHYEGCEKEHHDCALVRLAVERRRSLVMELTLERLLAEVKRSLKDVENTH